MPSTLELCEKFYGTRDVYKLFDVKKDASEAEIKKSYYRLSLKVHPDRVEAGKKEEATEKFKVLSKIHSVLADPNKRALYNERGVIDDDDDDSLGSKWLDMWQKFFKPISTEDITNFEKNYINSELERNDIKKAYLNGKGCINYMMNSIPFMSCEDEPRIAEIVKQMISSQEVPEYQMFTNEPKAKRDRRHKKYAKEKKEVESTKDKKAKNKPGGSSLEQQIALRNSERQQGFASLLDRLEQKYGNCEENDDLFDIDEYVAKKKSKAKATPQKKNSKPKEHKVKSGRVTKETAK
ncbi:J domain-containing protein CG6693 [Uranotaenia lowii]|uniref:J domain-containing protein CG6693 n=1 Tax=Uranotaenia lowii TaxID=190385 RepID=UPI0024785D17|nr:J domain-containing protein CG6693 [Uranotaenia lowii]XP_055589145.1 J domain-containing protein CG6693 [Uranotaenia lowii]XP_055589146.1 J domain-containing protein CG6693 [Uranotaenia lowii]